MLVDKGLMKTVLEESSTISIVLGKYRRTLSVSSWLEWEEESWGLEVDASKEINRQVTWSWLNLYLPRIARKAWMPGQDSSLKSTASSHRHL